MSTTLPSQGAIDDAEARQLLALYERLEADATITPRERDRLRGPLRLRLVSAAEQAHRRAARTKRSPDSVALPKDQAHILAQQQPAVPAAPPVPGAPTNARRDYGDDLARLIVATIAPESWEENGGNGSIYYYQPRQCLVVRQTDGMHDRLNRLIVNLRQP